MTGGHGPAAAFGRSSARAATLVVAVAALMGLPSGLRHIHAAPEPAVTGASPQAAAAGTVTQVTTPGGDTEVRLRLDEADVREVFASLADAAGWSFVALPGLSGRVSLSLHGLSTEQALELVARSTGFGYVREGATLVAGPREALEARFGSQAVRPAAPAVPAAPAPAEARAGNQVAIEALVVELFLSEMGQQSWLDPSSFVLSIEPASGVVRITPSQAMARLQTLEQRRLARLLARPRLTALSGRTASIFIGDQTPVVLRGESGSPDRLETISVGIKLEITPVVGDDGSITVDVRTEVSDQVGMVVAGGQALPQIRSRSATTRVRVLDGQAIFIGGLTRERETETRVGLPVLKEFPMVGQLFTSEQADEERTDMNILLFPRLIHEASAEAGAEPQLPGAPADPSPFPENLPGSTRLRAPRPTATEPRSGVRLSVSDAVSGAWQISLERAAAQGQGASTSLSVRPATLAGNNRGQAWGLGLEWRWYWPASPPAFWAGVGADALWVQEPTGSTAGQAWTLRIEAGARIPIARFPIFFEPYVRWIPVTSSTVANLEMDRWGRGLWAGVAAGILF